jgi:hypothetical protein
LHAITGVRQGDPLSTWLFSEAFQPVLKAVAELVPTLAFVDDANLVGRGEQLSAAVPLFTELCKADGRNLEAAPAKCQVYSRTPAEAAAVAAEHGFEHAVDGIVSFGTPIGSDDFVVATANKRADGIVAEIERLMALPAPVTKQMKWRMLQASYAVRMEHLKRTVPWELLAAPTQRVERAVQAASAKLWQLPADPAGVEVCEPEVLRQMTLPQRRGGFGLRVTTAAGADAALLSGAATAEAAFAGGEAVFLPLHQNNAARAPLLERWHGLHDRYADKCGWDAEARDLPAEFVAAALPRCGHDVTRAADDARGEAVLAACDLETPEGEFRAVRLRSGSSRAANAWLQAMPVVPTTRLSDRDFCARGRHQLGLGLPTAALQPPCTCRAGCASAPDHAMVCDHARGEARLRHDYITNVWCSFARKALFAVAREPRFARFAAGLEAIQRAGARRGDFSALVDDALLVADIVVPHAAQQKYRRAAARTAGAAAEGAATEKHREWRLHGDAEGKRFVALAMDSYGYHGDEAIKLMSEMGDAVAQAGGCKSSFVRALRVELSCALCKGLGRMYNKTEVNVVRASGSHFQMGHECVISDHAEE